MTLEQLRLFVAVAEREHMTRGAEAIGVTQSTASAAIAALEERHRVPLFHRVGRGIELTEAGHSLLVEARVVLDRAAAAERVLAAHADPATGRLRLVASHTIAGYWLPERLARLRAAWPRLRIEVALANTAEATSRVLDGDAELGLVEGEVNDPVLTRWTVAEDRLVLVASPDLADAPEDEAALARAPWVLREQGSGTRSSLEAALSARRLDPAALHVALVLPSNEAVRAAVEAGAGVAALSALVVSASLTAGRLRVLSPTLPLRPFYALRHGERHRTPAARALTDILRSRS